MNEVRQPGERVRFGLVGFGLFGAHHARAIARGTNTELCGIAVPSAERQAIARDEFPAAVVVGDYQHLLQLDSIEVVSVVAPNRLHAEIAEAALRANKHVLLEKPMGLSLEECDRLIAVAQSQQRVLAIGHELRLSSLWGGVKQLIDQGAIGEPRHVLVELSRFPYRQGSAGWRYDLAKVGSWILEEPIHFFDLAVWYLSGAGAPRGVYARGNSRQPDHPELTDNLTAIVDFDGGAMATVTQTLSAFGHHQTAKVAGTHGTIWAWWSAADARSDRPTFGLRYGLGAEVQEIHFDKPTGELLELADEIAAVADCVRYGGPPPCTAQDGRVSTSLCLAAQRSMETGQRIELAR